MVAKYFWCFWCRKKYCICGEKGDVRSVFSSVMHNGKIFLYLSSSFCLSYTHTDTRTHTLRGKMTGEISLTEA